MAEFAKTPFDTLSEKTVTEEKIPHTYQSSVRTRASVIKAHCVTVFLKRARYYYRESNLVVNGRVAEIHYTVEPAYDASPRKKQN